MINRITDFMFVILAAAIVSGCGKDIFSFPDQSPADKEIAFRPCAVDTRSGVNSTLFPRSYDMLVSAWRNVGALSGGDVSGNYFEDILFSRNENTGLWQSAVQPKYYPIDGTLDFLAVACAGLRDGTVGVVPSCTWGYQGNVARRVSVSVLDNSGKFDDIMYAVSNGSSAASSGTGITFRHACAAIVITGNCTVAYDSATNAGVTLREVSVDGARFAGTLTVDNPAAGGGSGAAAVSWAVSGEQAHVYARVWDDDNLGDDPYEPQMRLVHLGTSPKGINEYPFGDGYILVPEQSATSLTVRFLVHDGFEADGITPVNVEGVYTVPLQGVWNAGKKYVYNLFFDGDEMLLQPEEIDWEPAEVDITDTDDPPTFAGLVIAPGPLYYTGTKFKVRNSWNYDSYRSCYGVTADSYVFTFEQVGKVFDSRGESFTAASGSIDNGRTFSFAEHDDWRLPTHDEWTSIVTTSADVRPGATVNGVAGRHYALIKLSGVTHAGYPTPNGLLLFPDGRTITGKALSGTDNTTRTTGFSLSDLSNYIGQGCAFLPASGANIGGALLWVNGNIYGYYLSATEYSSSKPYYLSSSDYKVDSDDHDMGKTSFYASVRLVREP